MYTVDWSHPDPRLHITTNPGPEILLTWLAAPMARHRRHSVGLKDQPVGRQGVSHQLCSVLHIFGSRDHNHVEMFRPPGALSIQWKRPWENLRRRLSADSVLIYVFQYDLTYGWLWRFWLWRSYYNLQTMQVCTISKCSVLTCFLVRLLTMDN